MNSQRYSVDAESEYNDLMSRLRWFGPTRAQEAGSLEADLVAAGLTDYTHAEFAMVDLPDSRVPEPGPEQTVAAGCWCFPWGCYYFWRNADYVRPEIASTGYSVDAESEYNDLMSRLRRFGPSRAQQAGSLQADLAAAGLCNYTHAKFAMVNLPDPLEPEQTVAAGCWCFPWGCYYFWRNAYNLTQSS